MSVSLLGILKEKKVVDAYQYYVACEYKLYCAEISYQAIEKVEPKAIKALSDLASSGNSAGIVYDGLIDYLGVPTDADCVLDKLTMEIFGLLHGFFDSFAQWMNAAMFGEKACKSNKVSLFQLIAYLGGYPEYTGDFVNRLILLTNEPEYQYIADFNNTLKHRGQIFVKNQCSLISGKGEVSIPAFVKDKRVYAKEPLLKRLQRSLDYCNRLFEDSINYIEQYYASNDNKYVSHRVYNPKTYIAYESDDALANRRPFEHYYYIEVDSDHIPDFVQIMLCNENSDPDDTSKIELYNSPYEIIVLRDRKSEKILGMLRPEDSQTVEIKDGRPLMYRQYKVVTSGYERDVADAIDGRRKFILYHRLSRFQIVISRSRLIGHK